MVHDKIQLAIQEIQKLQEKLKGVKKDIKKEEKVEDPQYLEMKKALKDLRGQVKDFEEEYLEDLQSSDFYNQLREMRLQAEEDLAQAREKLFALLEKVPLKPFEIDVKEEEGMCKIQALPEMRIFVNGKEVKKD